MYRKNDYLITLTIPLQNGGRECVCVGGGEGGAAAAVKNKVKSTETCGHAA